MTAALSPNAAQTSEVFAPDAIEIDCGCSIIARTTSWTFGDSIVTPLLQLIEHENVPSSSESTCKGSSLSIIERVEFGK